VLSGGSGAVRVNSGAQLTTFDGCTFRNNNVNSGSTPDNEGGAVRVRRSNVSFIDCTFQNNTATNNRGAGIWLEALQSTARNALIRNCTFTGNETLGPTNQQGGAIGMSGRVVLTIENSDFANNIAPNAGGHIWNEQLGGGLIVSNTIFRDATSRQGAGIIFPARSDATVSFTDVQFRNLHAAVTPDNQGGDWAAANVTANNIVFTRVLVENCTARNVAGIKTAGTGTTSTTTIQDSIFRNLVATPVNNNGGDYGAGDIGGGITIVRNVTVSDCSAKFVGGLAVGGSTSSLVEDSTFTNCFGIPTATGSFGDVGGLRLSGTTATARRLTFNNCRSKIGGGLWAISTGTLTVEESTFTDCQAIPTASDSFGDGGGARLDGLNVIARNLTFVNNRARIGAGLHLSGGGTTSTAILEDITCIGGIAAPAPGGNANNARGGGIFVSRQGPTRLDRIRLVGNTAGRGGGLWSDSLDATLTNMLITGNTATDRGGGVMLDGIGGTPRKHVLSASTIVGNAAGGVVFGSCDAVAESSVSNTIVRASTGLANIQNFCGAQPTVDVTYSNIAGGYLGLGNIDDDPAFANPASGDYSLTASSTSINAGDAASLPPQITLDLARAARVAGGGLDIGAFEFQGGNPCDYDFNQDENVDLLDAQQMAQVFVGLISPEAGWLDGDLNGDENADLTDAQLLASFVVTGNCGV
jgi:parallel beta-helix repeat protein